MDERWKTTLRAICSYRPELGMGLFQKQSLASEVDKIGRHRQGTWLRQEQEARADKPWTICCSSLKANKKPLDKRS